jgi:hypothetical protein
MKMNDEFRMTNGACMPLTGFHITIRHSSFVIFKIV